jgi:hypothetical protein
MAFAWIARAEFAGTWLQNGSRKNSAVIQRSGRTFFVRECQTARLWAGEMAEGTKH